MASRAYGYEPPPPPFFSSRLCHVISFQLCTRCEVDAVELMLYVFEEFPEISGKDFNSCISWLRREGLVEEDIEGPPGLKECLSKGGRRSCLKKYPARVLLRPSPSLCRALADYIDTLGFVLWRPPFCTE